MSQMNHKLFRLYRQPMRSSRQGAIFNAYSYPTKINPSAVLPFILVHTNPGDVVLDPFAGSGSTGVASLLCDNTDEGLKENIEETTGSVSWGARNCILYDISQLACFISKNLTDRTNPGVFAETALGILEEWENDWGWLYAARGPHGEEGQIRHMIWSEEVICPHCGEANLFWDLAVQMNPPSISNSVHCELCGKAFKTSLADRVTETYYDDLLKTEKNRRVRQPVYVYGSTRNSNWERRVSKEDLTLIDDIEDTELPEYVPVIKMLEEDGKWGELHRSGYHTGITHLHHFYTRRNLIATGNLWKLVDECSLNVRDAIKFWAASYNAAHSTLMSRVVAKKTAANLVVTGAQPGALYISSLPVEKNILRGLRRKIGSIKRAFQSVEGASGNVKVICGSSTDLDLADDTIDYIFTDPPFGGNIQYSELSFINEAWIGSITDSESEAIISSHQGKSLEEYQAILSACFSEAYRVLKPGHYMTLVFHSTKKDVWKAVKKAWECAGFQLIDTSSLNKEQTSFKQTTTKGAVKGDPIILLRTQEEEPRNHSESALKSHGERILESPDRVISALLDSCEDLQDARMNLYGQFVRRYLEHSREVPIDAKAFYQKLESYEGKNNDG